MGNMTPNQLGILQSAANHQGIYPDDDGYKTHREWLDYMRVRRIQIGINKLRRILTEHAEVFMGSQPNVYGLTRVQVWYKIDPEHLINLIHGM